MKRRIVAFTCANLLLAMSIFTACSQNTVQQPVTNTETEAPVTEPTEAPVTEPTEANVPVKDYDGYQFRFVTNDHASLQWAYTTMDVEELTGEPINDAVYKRNQAIEEKYNITIVDIPYNFGAVTTAVQKSITAGSDDFDVIIEDIRYTTGLMTQNYLVEVKDIPYIDTTKPWWDKNVTRDLSLGGKLYYLGGDYSLAHYDTTCALIFNKNLMDTYHFTNPYELVKSGKWTYDAFESMIKEVSEDLNGDSKFTEEDRYGFTSLSFVFYPSFMMGANARSVQLDSEKQPHYVLGDEYTTKVFERLNRMMHIGNTSYDVIPLNKEHRLAEYMFAEDKALFWGQAISWTTKLRDMKSDFGIIPYPKFDESQAEYNVMVFGTPLTMIPTTNTNLERTGILLEAMAAESRKELIPAYYETTMKNKISRDDETVEILDILFSNRSYDLVSTYWAFIDDGRTKLFEKNQNDLASYVEKTRKKAESEIAKTMQTIHA